MGVDEKFVIHAFENGAPLVLVSGCHFADCHYIDAVTWTQRRIEKLWNKLERLGIRPEDCNWNGYLRPKDKNLEG